MKSKSISVPPNASPMIESLRGVGYTLPTALADIVDNSISADAKVINITFNWREKDSFIAVFDDGNGMTDSELLDAMKLGSKNPLETRSSKDLGRFGLGLKTAAFSQCRRLTVASKKQDNLSCYRWDLDHLIENNNMSWPLLIGPFESSDKLLERLSSESGTLVILEKLDRIVTSGFDEADYLKLIDKVEKHLSMVFHRFIERKVHPVTIKINDCSLKPWDPFLTKHTAIISSPVEKFKSPSGIIEFQCFVLPDKDKLSTSEYENAAGPAGSWTEHQGFYIYRGERLLVAGGWLNLGPERPWSKEKVYDLARIKLDLPNTADSDWKIDIRKSIARPPHSIRRRLTRLAMHTRDQSKQIISKRMNLVTRQNPEKFIPAWLGVKKQSGWHYLVNKDHVAFKKVLEQLSDEAPILLFLKVLEETVPVQKIYIEAGTPDEVIALEPASSELISILGVLFDQLIEKNSMSPGQARSYLLTMEPFNKYPELVSSLQTKSELRKK